MDLGLCCSNFGQLWRTDEALPSEGLPSLCGIQKLLHVTEGALRAEGHPARSSLSLQDRLSLGAAAQATENRACASETAFGSR